MTEYESVEEIEAEYRKYSEILLEKIQEREEMIDLLKIAQPAKIAEVREYIAKLDDSINRAEDIMETFAKLRETRITLDENIEDLVQWMNNVKPEFLKLIAEHQSEKLEEILAFLDKIPPGKTAH